MKYQKIEKRLIRNLTETIGLATALTVVLMGTGCLGTVDNDPDLETARYTLTPFENCDEMDNHLVDATIDQFIGEYYYYSYGRFENVDGGAPPQTTGAPGDDESPSGHTTTNNQEVGVDEADMMKTDGEHIYVLSGQTLHIVQSWPAEESHEVASVTLDGYGYSLFLLGDRLIAFTEIWEHVTGPSEPTEQTTDEPMRDGGDTAGEDFSGVRVTVIDITDRTAPVIEATHDLEASLVTARMIDGIIYMATNSNYYYGGIPYEIYEELWALELPYVDYMATEEEREAAIETAEEMIRPVIEAHVAAYRDMLLPDRRSNDGEREQAFTCSDIFRTEQETTLGLLAVLGFDPTTGEPPQGTAVLSAGYNVYSSDTAMFIAQDSRWFSYGPDDSPYAESFIHKFELNGLSPRYLASGVVPGFMLNQFSMSALDGYLRVATTDQDWWGGGMWFEDEDSVDEAELVAEPANNVFVLEEAEGELQIVGEVRGIAPGEQIFAVRFMGKRGYVVTFLQTDPLFSLDLSDPTNPQVLGELHIPGFSRYLHPIGDRYLIGVGQDADENGSVLGFQVQLFDVSDLSNPIRTHQEVISGGWSSSEAEWDHHAFTFDEERGLLAVPVTLDNWSDDSYSTFSGLIVYHVDTEAGFTELGRVSHEAIAGPVVCYDEWDSYCWSPPIRRSAFIDDFLFAISDAGISASGVDSIEDLLATVVF